MITREAEQGNDAGAGNGLRQIVNEALVEGRGFLNDAAAVPEGMIT